MGAHADGLSIRKLHGPTCCSGQYPLCGANVVDAVFIEGAVGSGTAWIALHGSGRDETDMPRMVRSFAPDAAVLSLRGAVAWDGGWAFFRRNADRSLDESDLIARTGHLERVLEDAIAARLKDRELFLIGCSNGAIMGASLILSGAIKFSGSVLLRPMPPFRSVPVDAEPKGPVLILDGTNDDRRVPDDAIELARQLGTLGAPVCHRTVDGGHAPTPEDIGAIATWLKTIPQRQMRN